MKENRLQEVNFFMFNLNNKVFWIKTWLKGKETKSKSLKFQFLAILRQLGQDCWEIQDTIMYI